MDDSKKRKITEFANGEPALEPPKKENKAHKDKGIHNTFDSHLRCVISEST